MDSLDNVHLGWIMFYPPGANKRDIAMDRTLMEVGGGWSWHHHWPGICYWLYCKPMVGVGSLGL